MRATTVSFLQLARWAVAINAAISSKVIDGYQQCMGHLGTVEGSIPKQLLDALACVHCSSECPHYHNVLQMHTQYTEEPRWIRDVYEANIKLTLLILFVGPHGESPLLLIDAILSEGSRMAGHHFTSCHLYSQARQLTCSQCGSIQSQTFPRL